VALTVLGLLAGSNLLGQIPAQGPTLPVFLTGDHEGEVEPCGCPKEDLGGVSRLAAFVDTLRTSGWEFLLLDAGDLLPSDEEFDSRIRLQARTLARTMALMHYDGITLGDHDLAPGPAFVRELVGWLGQPVLATNYALPDSMESVRSRLLEVRGHRIGLLAFLDPGLAGSAAPWLDVEPWGDQRDLVTSLRDSCDVLIALAHVPDTTATGRLIDLYPDLDLVLPAHEGQLAYSMYQRGGTMVLGSAARGRRLARVEIEFNDAGEPIRMGGIRLPVVESWGRRANVDTLLADYQQKLRVLVLSEQFQSERLSALQEPPVEYVGNETCASCHEMENAQWETSKHSHAHQTLIDADQDFDPDCQPCHTTGYGYRTGFATPQSTPDMWEVGCESCHGPGAAHVDDPEADYGEVTSLVCAGCHTPVRSPDFRYDQYFPLILHGN